MKADQAVKKPVKRIGRCGCSKLSVPDSAKAAECLAAEAVAEDYKGHYSRAINLYQKCQVTASYAMENDVKCDVLMNELRSMNDMYKKRVARLVLHLEEKREIERKSMEEKRNEKLNELRYEYSN